VKPGDDVNSNAFFTVDGDGNVLKFAGRTIGADFKGDVPVPIMVGWVWNLGVFDNGHGQVGFLVNKTGNQATPSWALTVPQLNPALSPNLTYTNDAQYADQQLFYMIAGSGVDLFNVKSTVSDPQETTGPEENTTSILTFVNNTDKDANFEGDVSIALASSYSFQRTVGFTVGVKFEAEAGIILASIKTELSLEVSVGANWTWTKSTTDSMSAKVTVTLPKGEAAIAYIVRQPVTLIWPVTYTGTIVGTTKTLTLQGTIVTKEAQRFTVKIVKAEPATKEALSPEIPFTGHHTIKTTQAGILKSS